ncbi:MAG: hypothetical protein IPM48_11070 [Saprospiraceae bacterium]|nr:hypothetical protein [Saprospiraceae bacterium]
MKSTWYYFTGIVVWCFTLSTQMTAQKLNFSVRLNCSRIFQSGGISVEKENWEPGFGWKAGLGVELPVSTKWKLNTGVYAYAAHADNLAMGMEQGGISNEFSIHMKSIQYAALGWSIQPLYRMLKNHFLGPTFGLERRMYGIFQSGIEVNKTIYPMGAMYSFESGRHRIQWLFQADVNHSIQYQIEHFNLVSKQFFWLSSLQYAIVLF